LLGNSFPWRLPYDCEDKITGHILCFSRLYVFLILAAQYESWSLPFSVLLGTPIAVMGVFLGLFPATFYVVEKFSHRSRAPIGLET
jgi:hypothetical protein